MKNKKAEMGVGTLIIFIAMLLVAAVAAGVLITTVSSLQQKALVTGQETRGEISTHASIVSVYGIDGTDGDLDNLTMIAKLAAGSDPIPLEDVLLSLGLSDSSADYRFNGTYNYTLVANGNVTAGNSSHPAWQYATSQFGINYLVNGTDHRDGMLVRGDVVSLFFYPPRSIIEDEVVRITFVPKIGTQSLVEFRSPDVISIERLNVYP